MRCIMSAVILSAFLLAQDPVAPPNPVEAPKEGTKPVAGEPAAKPEAKPVVLKVGDNMPSFDLPVLADGTREKSEDLRKGAKVLVLDFWSVHCPTCRVNESRFEALEKAFADKGVKIRHIASNRGEVADEALIGKLRERVQADKMKLPVLVDQGNKLADQFGAAVTPTCYVIDAKGVIQYTGALTDDMRNRKVSVDYLEDAVKAVLEGKAPDITSTRPEG